MPQAEYELILGAVEEAYRLEVKKTAAALAAAEESRRRQEEAKTQEGKKRAAGLSQGFGSDDNEEDSEGDSRVGTSKPPSASQPSSKVDIDPQTNTGGQRKNVSESARVPPRDLLEGFRSIARQQGKGVVLAKAFKREYSSLQEGTPDEYPDAALLRTWYYLDENSVPPIYKLDNIR